LISVLKTPPFRIQEEGWGEFDLPIGLTADNKEHSVTHDLNFAQARYESKHVIVRPLASNSLPPDIEMDGWLTIQTFKNPKPALLNALRESGPVPGDENGVKAKRAAGGDEGSKKRKKTEKNVSCFHPQELGWDVADDDRSTWTDWPMACRNSARMTSSRSCRWCMIIRRRSRIPRMILSVSVCLVV
jgi:hypothetical protein